MKFIRDRFLTPGVRVYFCIALIVAAVFSTPAQSFVPVFLLIGYGLIQWIVRSRVIKLLGDYLAFFAVSILLASIIPPWATVLISLPVLLIITQDLSGIAGSLTVTDTKYRRMATRLGLLLGMITLINLAVSLLILNLALVFSSVAALIYLVSLGAIAVKGMPSNPVREEHIRQRIVAGETENIEINLTVNAPTGEKLVFETADSWVKIHNGTMSLKDTSRVLKLSVTPALSGPSTVTLKGYSIDRWGLTQVRFEIEPVELIVMPRARFAAWLANRYLATSKPGTMSQVSNVGSLRPLRGLRSGLEYYGSQQFQEGDSYRNIDWKHSTKFDKLISKQFIESGVEPAIMLVNMVSAGPEDADKLAFKILTTALSLAQSQIPVALATYDNAGIKLVTSRLNPRDLVLQALGTIHNITTEYTETMFLKPPDVIRLKANIGRMNAVKSDAASILSQLLKIEYDNLKNHAKGNSLSNGLARISGEVREHSSVVIVSQLNHDADVVPFMQYTLNAQGSTLIIV